jgi:Saxitoxin biosynthesis operon protein SxtJ
MQTFSARSFGITVGLVLCINAAALLWKGWNTSAEIAGMIGAALLLLGLGRPSILSGPAAAWWRFSRTVGHINTRLLLTLVFSLLFVPISLLWRLTGIDPLARRRDRWPGWTPFPPRYRDKHHYRRMF